MPARPPRQITRGLRLPTTSGHSNLRAADNEEMTSAASGSSDTSTSEDYRVTSVRCLTCVTTLLLDDERPKMGTLRWKVTTDSTVTIGRAVSFDARTATRARRTPSSSRPFRHAGSDSPNLPVTQPGAAQLRARSFDRPQQHRPRTPDQPVARPTADPRTAADARDAPAPRSMVDDRGPAHPPVPRQPTHSRRPASAPAPPTRTTTAPRLCS